MSKLSLKLPVLQARPRDVVVLPDHRFFVRSITLDGETEGGPVRDQIELALEAVAPFPLGQMLWGYWTKPDCGHALVFAAYRKRFTTEEMEGWGEAEWVAPHFGAVLATANPAAATTWILTTADGVTAVHFGDDTGVPTEVRSVALTAEAGDPEIAAAREHLIKACGGSKAVEDLAAVTVTAGEPGTDELLIGRGDVVEKVEVDQVQPMDVRDHEELTARRRARVRDMWLWRTLVASLVALGLAGVAELSLWGTSYWRNTLHQQVAIQVPVVSEIETADRLANRIDELQTKRLRPFEMIAIVDGPRPESIIFLRTAATGLYSLEIEAETNDAPAINAYVAALTAMGKTEGVEILNLDTRGSRSTVRVLVRFTYNAFQTAPVVVEEVSG